MARPTKNEIFAKVTRIVERNIPRLYGYEFSSEPKALAKQEEFKEALKGGTSVGTTEIETFVAHNTLWLKTDQTLLEKITGGFLSGKPDLKDIAERVLGRPKYICKATVSLEPAPK